MVGAAPSALTRRMVRRQVESQMNSQITILRGALATLDPTTGLVGGITGSSTVYQGKARIRIVSGSGTLTNGGGPQATRDAIISIPIGSPVPHRDDVITVQATNRDADASEADTDLDQRSFRVLDVEGGSYFGDARRMSCTQFFNSRDWSPS